MRVYDLCYPFSIVSDQVSPTVSPETTDTDRWGIVRQKASEARAARAFDLFRQHGIEPILIKGIGAALYYPPGLFRDAVDMDLAVSSADLSRAEELARSADAKGLAIDLHNELRHHDVKSWDELMADSQIREVEGGGIRILCAEDHLRVLCTHWLTDGGRDRDRLWDIYYLVDSERVSLDWDKVLTPVDKRRRRWLTCSLGAAHRYLGLDLSDTPIENESKDLPSWFTSTIEKEWAEDIQFAPVYYNIHDRKLFLHQLRRRFPPNPITATILSGGDLDSPFRAVYQVQNIISRLGPSVVNIIKAVFRSAKKSDA